MTNQIIKSTETMLRKIKKHGVNLNRKELEDLSHKSSIPNWIIELFSSYPLAGLQVGAKVTDSFGGLKDEPVLFEIVNANLMHELNTESYPGMYLFSKGYLTIGIGVESMGDVLVIDTKLEDPKVYQVWHDVSHDPDELEKAIQTGARGTWTIAESLSLLFTEGLIEEPY